MRNYDPTNDWVLKIPANHPAMKPHTTTQKTEKVPSRSSSLSTGKRGPIDHFALPVIAYLYDETINNRTGYPMAIPPKRKNTNFRIKLRGKDDAPLSMKDLRQGLYDIARKLSEYSGYRTKWVMLYLTMVNEDGREVRINKKGEWTIYPYRSAADENKV